MAKINKEIDIGNGVILKLAINDGIAVLTSNYGKEILKFYHQAKEAGKNVEYDYRRNAMIEHFTEPIEDYSKKIDFDFETAKIKQKEAKEWAEEKVKEGEVKK